MDLSDPQRAVPPRPTLRAWALSRPTPRRTLPPRPTLRVRTPSCPTPRRILTPRSALRMCFLPCPTPMGRFSGLGRKCGAAPGPTWLPTTLDGRAHASMRPKAITGHAEGYTSLTAWNRMALCCQLSYGSRQGQLLNRTVNHTVHQNSVGRLDRRTLPAHGANDEQDTTWHPSPSSSTGSAGPA